VDFRVGGDMLVQPSDGDWTVSAAALYLLRTLSQSHTKSHPVADHLFPCCGHAMFEAEGEEDVVIIGCPNGMDFELVHTGATVVLAATDGRRYEIQNGEWRASVYGFADAVQRFYNLSTPKAFEDEDAAKGFKRF
jgi:hypothetical protein